MQIIGIGGGSGAGKSAACYALQDAHPETFEIINLDDYQKLKTASGLPMFENVINWDHPDIILWSSLVVDIKKMRSGEEVTINSWAHRSNPDYAETGQMIPRVIKPKPVLLVEGYLALYNVELNRLYDRKFYFELDELTRNQRRAKAKLMGNSEYEAKVLAPMFKQFVEPTKATADEVINIAGKSIDDVKDYLWSRFSGNPPS